MDWCGQPAGDPGTVRALPLENRTQYVTLATAQTRNESLQGELARSVERLGSAEQEDLVVAYIASVGQELLRERVCQTLALIQGPPPEAGAHALCDWPWKVVRRHPRHQQRFGRHAGAGAARVDFDFHAVEAILVLLSDAARQMTHPNVEV